MFSKKKNKKKLTVKKLKCLRTKALKSSVVTSKHEQFAGERLQNLGKKK